MSRYSKEALEEYGAALNECKAAQSFFDTVEPERIDEATYRLKAAEMRLDAALRALKEERYAG